MLKAEKIDSIVFDLKQSIEDLSHELKIMAKEINELQDRVKNLEKK